MSFGILLVTVGGSWDITNHLLNKPETFFSPPHALMYSGVAIALIGVVVSFVSWKNLKTSENIYSVPLKIQFIGIGLLSGAGPFDFVWHSNFGLDGLLSPPHLTLIFGMLLCSIGGMVGITRYLKSNNFLTFPRNYFLILAILPIWLAGSGVISSLSLPFSNTDYFQFNPDPFFAFIVATIAYPFLISFSMFMSSKLSGYRFGCVSILGGMFLLVYSSTAIVPNFALLDSIVFYSFNLIPFVASDILFSLKRPKLFILASGLLGSVFYMAYYPYVMYTFNEVLLGKLVSPSMIYFVYFEIIETVFYITLIPSIFSGIFGFFIAKKFSKKVLSMSA
ncbi:hypothetical protein NsoK4_03400 [Nitrosopumilus sp. K4]|uniref:hypothetical protein n=1 Tax=Nitrosopumilus sp. K4 TaxID=2795383 RepID=UPI001BAA3272|nr:hypothetical protein [Nitrosopumilus sp. K4]QUC65305.1 hypothetical protein NsoK4_03400 [Nitrosopumilus sp. K4]